MRTIQKNLLITCTALSLVLGLAAQASAEVKKIGVVGANSATLSVLGADGAKRVLQQGDAIYLNDTVMTDSSGRAQIVFEDRSTVMVKENSQLKIDTFIFNPADNSGKMSMTAAKGVLRFIGGALSKKQPVEIHTPVATIGIRGGVADTHIDGATGKTSSTFLYGKELSVESGGQTMSVTTPSTALAVNELGAPIQPVPQSQVEQNLGSFSNTEGGATVGAQEIPSREQVQTKTSEIAKTEPVAGADGTSDTSTSKDSGGSDSGAASSGDSGDKGNKDSGGTDGGGNGGGSAGDSGAGNSSDAGAGNQPNTSASSGADGGVNAPVSAQPVAQATDAPSGVFVAPIDTSATNVATNVASVAVMDQIKTDKVVEVTTPPVKPVITGSTDTTSGGGSTSGSNTSGSGSGGTQVGGTTGGDTTVVVPVTPVVPPTTDTSSTTTDTKVAKPSTIAAELQGTLMGQYLAMKQTDVGVEKVTDKAQVNHFNIRDTSSDTVLGTKDVLATPSMVLAQSSAVGLAHAATSSTTLAGNNFDTWIYNSPYLAMAYYHMISDDATKQFNLVVGKNITAAQLNSLTSGYSVYRRLPDLNKWLSNSEFEAALNHEVEATGVVVDWQKDRFLFAKLPWFLTASATDRERAVAMGTLNTTNTSSALTGVTITHDGTLVKTGTAVAGLDSIYDDGAGGVEGLVVTRTTASNTDITPLERVSGLSPAFMNQVSELPEVAYYNNHLTQTDASPLLGFTGGLVTTATTPKVVLSTDISKVQMQRDASAGTVGVQLEYTSGDVGATGISVATTATAERFGTRASGGSTASTLMTNNTYVASNTANTAYVASGNLVSGAGQCSNCRYAQWGVWGGNTSITAVAAKADAVPYVVGEVTQNLASRGLSGDVTYTGVANANISVNNALNNYSGTMDVTASLGARTINTLNLNFADVGGVGKTLDINSLTPMTIAPSGNATFNGALGVVYDGYASQQGYGKTYGALFGPTAQEIAGNVAFATVETGTGNVVKGAGIYLGTQ
jgi:hypothetical protein